MAASRHNMPSRMFSGLLSVVLALAALAAPSATKPAEFACPKLNATLVCDCTSRGVACDRLGISDTSFIAPSSAIEILSAAHNAIRELPADFLHGAANLAQLTLSHNKIANIDTRLFENLTALVFLDLSYNELKKFYLPGNVLPRLKNLSLQYNVLSSLRFDADRPNEQFSTLRLDGNNLTDLTGVFGYNKLKSLHVSRNRIGNNLNFVSNLTKLNHLILGSNNISEIHYSVFLSNDLLKYLDLSDNRLTDLGFINCTVFLRVLDVTSNRIYKLPENIFAEFGLLDTLHMAHNNITDSSFLHSMRNFTIQRLDLSYNKLSNINVTHMKHKNYLEYIDVSYNELSDIDFAGSLKQLKTLFANNNKIYQISNAVFSSNRGNLIRNLDLSNNLITNITFLKYLHNIINLNLSNNYINHIPEDTMSQLMNLTLLNLSNNKIKDINFVHKVPNLIALNLSNNSVEQFPCNYFMQRAFLDGNPIANLDIRCAPHLRFVAVYGGALRDRKEQELRISKEVLIDINNQTVTFPCVPSINVIVKCKDVCNSEDADAMVCEPDESIFTSPVAFVVYCICVSLVLLVIVFIAVKCYRTQIREVHFTKQCSCGKGENVHMHQSVLRNSLQW